MKKNYFLSIFFLLVLFVSLALPLVAQAAESDTIDQRCWKKQDCIEARKELGADEAQAVDGFYASSLHTDAMEA